MSISLRSTQPVEPQPVEPQPVDPQPFDIEAGGIALGQPGTGDGAEVSTSAADDAAPGAGAKTGSITRTPLGAPKAAGRRSGGKAWKRWVSPLAILAIWQLASGSGLVSAQKVPSPLTVWHTAVNLVTTNSAAYGTLQSALVFSLERVAMGFGFGAAFALIAGVIAGVSRFGEYAVDPPMQMLRTLPLFGLVPVFIVWFGIGQVPKVLLIAIGATIPLYLNTFAGIRSVDAKLAELGQVLHLSRRQQLRHIVLPGALPQVLVGLRQSLGVAWLALVVAEQLNVSNGLGFMINQATEFLQNDVIFVVLAVYTILGLLTDSLVRLVERRTLTWRRGLVV